ncbi:hypothetical protein RND81_11G044400 [Saponaria officinalis]|uniref:Uncharacterized protein n=1 Tax=Saponaria officinalis TaxID=3572 RepID=A0AAW1HI00_SAPOF
MIVSALLTSVGINSGLCVLFFTLYSILRRQPGNHHVYLPRVLAVQGIDRSQYFVQRLIPSLAWVKAAWKLSEDELLSTSGLDAVVFIRIITFSLKVFLFVGAIGLFVLLPINASGTQVVAFDIAVVSSVTLDLFTISNVNNSSKWLWVHCCSVYLVTGFVCFLLYCEYDYICSKRLEYFYSSRPRPHQFTILVRGIPVPPESSISESVDRFFKKYHPSTYLSHVMIHRTNKLWHLVEVRSAFVFFKTRYGATIASRLQQSENPTEWITEKAPDPDDVYWPFFQSSFLRRWMSKVVIIVTYILVTVLFILPVVLVQGLTNLSQLEILFPFLQSIWSAKYIREVITGYLPNLILQLFLNLIPPVMEFLSSIQGHISHSEIQRSACNKFLWFMVWNVFFANVLSGSIFTQLSELLDLRNIPSRLATNVPAQASFFIAYVVTSGWTSTSSDLFRIFQFIHSLLQKYCCCCSNKDTADEYKVQYIRYHREIPRILFFGLLGITYFFLAPLILPFLLVYFSLAYIIFKNQFINVYSPKFESAGKFWPTVHNSMIFSLLLMHAIAVGIFTLKKLQMASSLIFPLPVLTLLFNEYCRKRFLPNFVDYSAKTLMKKDREDANDREMPQFFDQLIAAYMDPALSPAQFSDSDGPRVPNHSDNHTDSLLSTV